MNENKCKQVFIIKKVKKQTKWTPAEDKFLIEIVKDSEKPKWKIISSYFQNKSPIQCFSRYWRIHPGIKRGPWSESEDIKLIELVSKYGKNWSLISKKMINRNNKQIRDRYVNILDPTLNKNAFTVDDDLNILQLESFYGKNWSKIAKFFDGRSPDNIRIRYYSIKKRTKTKFDRSFQLNKDKFKDMELISNNISKESNILMNNFEVVHGINLSFNETEIYSKINFIKYDSSNFEEGLDSFNNENRVPHFNIDDYFNL